MTLPPFIKKFVSLPTQMPGYFKRWNCLREAREAIVQQKHIILLRETAEMHGGGGRFAYLS